MNKRQRKKLFKKFWTKEEIHLKKLAEIYVDYILSPNGPGSTLYRYLLNKEKKN